MDANIVVTQVTSAAVVVWGIQKLKAASWFPWLKNNGQVWAKRLLSVGTALLTHAGISHVWNPAPAGATFLGTITFTIPMASVMLVGLWHWLNQYVMQELIYQGTSNRSAAPTLEVKP